MWSVSTPRETNAWSMKVMLHPALSVTLSVKFEWLLTGTIAHDARVYTQSNEHSESKIWMLTNRLLDWSIFMGAGNFACQFSKVGLCSSRQPSTRRSGSLRTKLGINWVCTAKYQIFLFKIEILSPKCPQSGLKKHKIIAWKSFLPNHSALIDHFECNRWFALIIKNESLLPKNQHPWVGLWF